MNIISWKNTKHIWPGFNGTYKRGYKIYCYIRKLYNDMKYECIWIKIERVLELNN